MDNATRAEVATMILESEQRKHLWLENSFAKVAAQFLTERATQKHDIEACIFIIFNLCAMLIKERDNPVKAKEILDDLWVAALKSQMDKELSDITAAGAREGVDKQLRDLRRRAMSSYDPRLDTEPDA